MGNSIHQHLLVNHVPIVASVLAVPLLLLTLFLRRERGLLLASVFVLAATAVSGVVALRTGDDAMMTLEGQSGDLWFETYDEARLAVNEHEHRAHTAMWVAGPTAVLGGIVLWLAHRRPPENPLPRPWIGALLAGSIATALAMAYVGNAGGVIMHREIRGDSLDTTKPEPDRPK